MLILYGIIIVDNKTYDLQSGFTIEITTLPPYYMDFVYAALPLPDYPVRTFTNVAGDTFLLEYEPPDEVPDVADEEEYLLCMEWHSVHSRRAEVLGEQVRAKRNFLLSNCVFVVDGPYDLDDDEWVVEVEGGLHEYGYNVPSDPAGRRMAFILSKVITSNADWIVVRDNALYSEIDMDGVAAALVSLGLEWDGVPILDVMADKEPSLLKHDTRLWEAEVAEAAGVPFDGRWYDIPVKVREMMVAAHVGRKWADSLVNEQAVEKAQRRK